MDQAINLLERHRDDVLKKIDSLLVEKAALVERLSEITDDISKGMVISAEMGNAIVKLKEFC